MGARLSPAHSLGPALTSPSLPSQGSLVLMAGKAPPPTGAVDPRPKDSSLGGNSKQGLHQTAGAGEERTCKRMAGSLLKNLMNSITFSIRDNHTTRHKIPKALASGKASYYQ